MKFLLINPSYAWVMAGSRMQAATPAATTPLGLLCVAAALRQDGHRVEIHDENVAGLVLTNTYDVLGVTATTAVFPRALEIAQTNPNRAVLMGGHHVTVRPQDEYPPNVMVMKGECDRLRFKVVEDPRLDFKVIDALSEPVINLDDLPLPAYDLLCANLYAQPSIMVKANPVAFMETSRGCYARCNFCSHAMFGHKLRFKSPERVLEEIRFILKCGFREIQIIDDNFTSDMDRAAKICEAIIESGLNFPWNPRNGIRADRVNLELLRLMKRAGCYKVFFGVESGSQRILDSIGKWINREEIEEAVQLSKQAGLETGAYFMAGFPDEKEEDLKRTLRFACRLNTDHVSMSALLPLPGTELFAQMDKAGQIKTKDWGLYNFFTPTGVIYDHPLDIAGFIRHFYFRYYFRPSYILKKLRTALREGNLWEYIRIFVKIRWW